VHSVSEFNISASTIQKISMIAHRDFYYSRDSVDSASKTPLKKFKKDEWRANTRGSDLAGAPYIGG
jgi:hypothetical protein